MKLFLTTLPLLFLILPSLTAPASLTFITKSGDKATIFKISQDQDLNHCKVKAFKTALYVCEKKAFLFQGSIFSERYVKKVLEASSVFDADIDRGKILMIAENKLNLIDESIPNAPTYDDFKNKLPILGRIKTKTNYALIMVIYQPENIDLKSTVPADPQARVLGKRQDQAPTEPVFIVRSYVVGRASHFHEVRFPYEGFDFQLAAGSFKEALVFTDTVFGKDYFFVALQSGWLSIFRSFFEDPQFDYVQSIVVRKDFEIKQMANADAYLFFLLENLTTKEFFLEIFKIQTVHDFELQKACSINLTEYYNLSDTFQLKVKHVDNTYLISINLPGLQIITFTFQKPTQAIFNLTCPTSPYILNYNNVSSASSFVKIGYTFDYVIRQYDGGFTDYGFLLTPITKNHQNSYFIPYCMPNYYMNQDGACLQCPDGYSQGGLSTSCKTCQSLVDENHTLVTGKNPLIQTCPMACKMKGRYGPNCESCQEYLANIGANLPSNAIWSLDEKGECTFSCDGGRSDKLTGKCLNSSEVQIVHDNCGQFSDCMNCTMSHSCSWCGSSCMNSKDCNKNNKNKGDIIQDFFLPAMQCSMEQPCGPRSYKEAAGNFSFSENSVYKNQLCVWYPDPQYGDTNEIKLTLFNQEVAPYLWDNPPLIFMKYCSDELYLEESCQITRLPRDNNKSLHFRASNVVFFVWVQESIQNNATDFRLEYLMTPAPSLIENLFTFLRIFSQFLFVGILFTCLLSTCQNFYSLSRRRRLIRQLQALEIIRLVHNGESEPAAVVNVQEIMENNNIVSNVVYENQNNEYEQTECPICLESFRNQENLAKLSCKHLFHMKCFSDWVKATNVHQHVKCPVCNRILE